MTDLTLLQRWRLNGDATAFREIVARHAGLVYGTCLRILRNASDAEDVAQECFEVLATRPSEPTLHLGAWLHRVATNRSISRIRSEQKRRRREETFESDREQSTAIEWDDIYSYVDEAIEDLPEEYRTPLVTVFFEGQSKAAVARDLGVSPRTVGYRIDKGIERIRRSLRKGGVAVSAATMAGWLSAQTAEAAPLSLSATLSKLAISGAGASTAKASTGVAAWIGGAIIMKKAVLIIAAVVAIVTGALVIGGADEEGPVSPPETMTLAGAAEEPSVQETVADVNEPPVDGTEAAPSEPAALADVADASVSTTTGSITGRVFDAVTGEGIAGVTIEATTPDLESQAVAESRPTDKEGRYALEGLAAGRYRMHRSTPEGYQRTLLTVPRFLSVKEGAPLNDIDFPLRKEVPLAGMVVDESGRAVAGATVSLAGGSGTYVSDREETAADGLFSFHGLSPTSDLWLVALKGDHLRSSPVEVRLTTEGKKDLQIVLSKASTVSGIVIDGAGTPVADVLVVAQGFNRSRTGGSSQFETGPDGRFVLSGLTPGRYKMRLRDAGQTSRWSNSDSGDIFELSQGDHIEDLTMVYEGSYTISGHVYDAKGKPLEGLRVSAGSTRLERESREQNTTNEDGWFELANLGDGQYHISLKPYTTGVEAEARNVQAGRDDVVLVVREPTSVALTGVVIDAETGEPLQRFELTTGGYTGAPTELWAGNLMGWDPTAHPDGRFSVRSEMGFFQIAARAPGYATVIQHFDLSDARGVENILFALPPDENVHGVVEDGQGNPIEGAYLFYGHDFPNLLDRSSAVTDERGGFELASFPANDQRVAAYHPDYSSETIMVAASHDRSQPLRFVLTSGGVVEGNVTIADGPYYQIGVEISKAFGEPALARATVDDSRAFRLENIPAGEAELVVGVYFNNDKRRAVAISVLVENGKTTVADVEISDATGVITGAVALDMAEVKFAYALVTLETAVGKEYCLAGVESDGTYRVEHVAAGSGTVQVFANLSSGETLKASADITLAEGEEVTLDFDLTGR